MSLKYVPLNAPSLITSIGVLFTPKSIYKTPLTFNTELFNLLTTSFLLIPHKIHLESTPFTFNIALLFNFISSHQNILTFITNMRFRFKSNIFKIPIVTKHTFFWCACFVHVSSFWNTNFLAFQHFITHTNTPLNKFVDTIFHLLEKHI